MFLEKFRIQNFRGISDLTLTFNNGLNIIIGENNSGKTRIIDALRICLSYKDNDKTIYVKKTDFTVGLNELEPIEFTLYFKADEIEEELFFEIYNGETKYFEIHYKYYIKIKNNRERIFNKVWGGPFEGERIPDEIFHYLEHIYLDPLRDSGRYLHPGRNNILGKFFSKVESEEHDKDDLIHDLNEKINEHEIINFVKNSKKTHIDSHLDGITHDDFPQFNINLIPKEFDRFVENFFITLPIDGGNLELSQNGLGYNNLIYMSILLGDLKESNDETVYTALCVEEPEAHLHPQLQKLFFNYLANNLTEDYPFQIFMTSHSPILVSHANLDSLIILENINRNINAINWTNLNLNDKNINYFNKFFDTSKVNLLFSKKVILVEGPTERILLPFFGKIKNFSFENENIELIETNGNQNMFHYAKLFSNTDGEEHLKKKCVILVDNDKNSLNDNCDETAKKLWDEYNHDNIKVFISEKDFEFEIINSNKDNVNILKYLLLDKTIVTNISLTKQFLNKLSKTTDENLIYDYVNKINFKKTNLPIKIINEWENLEGFKIPKVIEDVFEFLKED